MARGRYTNDKESVHCYIENLAELVRGLALVPERLAEAERLTCSDLRTWVPGHVSTATARIYNITKAEVANIKGRYTTVNAQRPRGRDRRMWEISMPALDEGYTDRGRNAGKGNVRVSSEGTTLANITWIFRGRKHANWTTRAGKQRRVPKARKRIKKGNRTYSVPKPYVTTVETYRGKRTPIRGRNGNRVFVMDGKHGLRAMVVKPGSRRALAHGSSSIPQAIMNEQVVAIWRPQLITYAMQRFMYHAER